MTARIAAIGALAAAVVVAAIVLLGGSSGTTYFMHFQTAGQLVKDDDVQVGGRRIGSIREITLTDDNVARVKVEVSKPFAPLHAGTTAIIRATSLSGVANRYIALVPGPQSEPELPAGATLSVDKATTIVDLDQLFNTLDPDARKSLQQVVKGFEAQYQGAGDEAGKAAEYFNPALSTSRRLLEQLTADEGVLTRFLVNSSRTVSALAERREDIAGLVSNTNTTARAIGAENVALARALGLLPTTLRRANSTFVNLRATLADLDELVAASKPATKDLEPFLRQLRPLVRSARPTIADLRRLVRRSGPDNDLVEATLKLPRLQRVASPALERGRAALVKTQPVLEFIRPYTPDLVGWLRDFGQGASAYDANGHYARIQPIVNAFSFTDSPAGGLLNAIPPSQRLDSLVTGQQKRCPGTASQPAPDKSNPYKSTADCDESQLLPGP